MPVHALAYGPATPQQEGVGGRVATKEKWPRRVAVGVSVGVWGCGGGKGYGEELGQGQPFS